MAKICETQTADDIGLVYAIFFNAAIPSLLSVEKKGDNFQWAEAWGRALRTGINSINQFFRPKQGKKTLVFRKLMFYFRK